MTDRDAQADVEATRLFGAAVALLATGDDERAVSMCREVLARNADHGGALHLLGVIAHKAGRRDEAFVLLSRAATLPDARPLHALTYSKLLWECGRAEDALMTARAACASHPRDPTTRAHLGRVLLRMQRTAEAVEALSDAVALDSAAPGARLDLAVALAMLGDSDAALAQFEQILADDPDAVQAMLGVARMLVNLGRHDDAQQSLERAVIAHPDDLDSRLELCSLRMRRGQNWRALCELQQMRPAWQADRRAITLRAHALRALDRNDAAIALCEQAQRDGIASAEIDHALGLALHAAGRSDEGLVALARSSSASTNPAAALSDQGVLLSDLGRVDEACAAFDAALALAPDFVDAWYNKSNAKTYAATDPDIVAMERLAAQKRPARDQMLLHFALGKAYGDSHRLDHAFGHWHAGNRCKRALIEYDRAAIARRVDEIVATDWRLGQPTSSGSARESTVPGFVVGMPRCGSTLVEQILAAHPAVRTGGETLQLRAVMERYTPPEVDPPAHDPEALAVAVLDRLTRVAAGHLRVVDKDLQNFLHLGAIHALFPNARIIHCRRDALDTCVSAYTKLFAGDLDFTYDLSELGAYYREYARLMQYWRTTLPSRVLLEVDYERLVTDPHGEIPQLIQFVGLDWDDRCLSHFEQGRTVITASQYQVRRPIYRTSVGRAAPVRAHIAPLIVALGDLAQVEPDTSRPD